MRRVTVSVVALACALTAVGTAACGGGSKKSSSSSASAATSAATGAATSATTSSVVTVQQAAAATPEDLDRSPQRQAWGERCPRRRSGS